MENIDWQPLLATLVGGGGAAVLLRLLLQSAFSKLAAIPEELSKINIELAKIGVELTALKDLQVTVQMHDRKIATLEAISGVRKRNNANGRDTSA